MNLIIAHSDLKALAARAAAVVPDKPTTPLLGCVVLDVKGDGIDVTASDSSITYRGRTLCNVVAPGRIAIPARDLLGAAKNLPEEAVQMSIPKDGRVLLVAGRSKVTLSTHDPNDYPMPPDVDTPRTLTLPAADLARIIDDVMCSVAPDDNKLGFSVVKVEFDGRTLRFAATDGVGRLAWSEVKAEGEPLGPRTTLPRRGLTELRKLLDAGGPVTLALGDRAAVATIGTSSLHMRLSEVDFPDYRQVLPTSFQRSVMLDREPFLVALRRVSYISDTVKLDIRDGRIVMTTTAVDRGESVAEVDAELAGEPLVMGYVAPILTDALSSMGGDRVLFRLGDALSPGQLTDPDYPDALWIAMPARLP